MILLLAFTAALCTSLVLTPVARAVARHLGVVDRPDGKRKLQQAPVALWGGIAVYSGLCAGLAAATVARVPGQPVPARLSLLIIISGGLLGLVGLIDDTYSLRARSKLLLQVLAVSPLVLAGFYPQRLIVLGAEMPLGMLGPPIMLFWLVTCVNALNLLDGLDGFASVVGIVVSVVVAAVGLLSGNFAASVAAGALAGAISGFLPFNLPPASIYLGDAGSMLIGLTLGALSMQATDITGETFVAVVPLTIMALPLWDTAMAVLRRQLRGISIGAPDRDHLHHRVLARGLSNVQALVLVACLCLLAGGAVLVAIRADWELLAVLGGVTVVCVLAATRIFGEEELSLFRRAAAARTVQGAAPLVLPTRYQGVKVKRLISGLSLDQAWTTLVEIVEYLDCDQAELAFSDDSVVAPRIHRRERLPDAGGATSNDRGAVITAIQASPGGMTCEVRVTLTRSRSRAPCTAACLVDVLSVFAVHFLRIAVAESQAPMLHVIADENKQRAGKQQRAA